MPVSLHLLVCQAQNFDKWCIMVPALQICKELENHCPTLRDIGNEICVIFVKMKSWQNAKFLELSAPDPLSATTSIPINFDHLISKCYYVQLQLLLAFHIINIPTQSVASPRTPHLSMIYVHCDLDLWPLTSKINRVHPLIMVDMSAKFDKEICNGLVSIVFTRFSHGRKDARTEPQKRYYIPTATRCAGIKI